MKYIRLNDINETVLLLSKIARIEKEWNTACTKYWYQMHLNEEEYCLEYESKKDRDCDYDRLFEMVNGSLEC